MILWKPGKCSFCDKICHMLQRLKDKRMKEKGEAIHSNPVSLNGLTITRFVYERSSDSIRLLLLVALFVFATGQYILAQEPFLRQARKFEMPELRIANPAGLAFAPA